MDASLKELEFFTPEEKAGDEDRVAVFSYSNVSQVEEDRLNLSRGSQGKKTRKRTSNTGKSQEGQCQPNRRNDLEKK